MHLNCSYLSLNCFEPEIFLVEVKGDTGMDNGEITVIEWLVANVKE